MLEEMVLVDKPAGMTSFGVVARVRRVLSEQAGKRVKVGHTGTLDPFATGLLILMVGEGTKKAQEFLKLDKCYEATVRLGWTSTTGDPEGEISQKMDIEEPALEEVEKAVEALTGEIEQKVPVFSAVKIEGKRAYDLARKGVAVEMPVRKVKIYSLEILDYQWPELKIRCKVSSGTYIRALAEDLGEKLGVGGYLTALRRTQVGEYKVEEARKLDDIMK